MIDDKISFIHGVIPFFCLSHRILSIGNIVNRDETKPNYKLCMENGGMFNSHQKAT